MRSRELEFLCNLTKRGSITDVAKAMHMTQPNASKMLKKLEDHFGLLLFERQNGRLHPTEEGRLLAEQAETSLISLQRLESQARNLREIRHGSLTIGVTPQLSWRWLPVVMAEFMSVHPGVLLRLQTKDSRHLIELIAQRQLDFALGTLALPNPNVEYQRILETELLAAIPAGHPLSAKSSLCAKAFHQIDFITSSILDHTREQVDEFFTSGGVHPVERAEASLSVSRLRLVEKGIGVAIIDNQTAREMDSEQVEFRPLEPAQHLTLWAMRPQFQPKSKLVESFRVHVFNAAKTDFGADPKTRVST